MHGQGYSNEAQLDTRLGLGICQQHGGQGVDRSMAGDVHVMKKGRQYGSDGGGKGFRGNKHGVVKL